MLTPCLSYPRKRTRPAGTLEPRKGSWYFLGTLQIRYLTSSPVLFLGEPSTDCRAELFSEYFGQLCLARFHDTTNLVALSNHLFVSPRLDLNTEIPTSSIRLKNLIKQLLYLPLWILLACIFAEREREGGWCMWMASAPAASFKGSEAMRSPYICPILPSKTQFPAFVTLEKRL